MGTMLTDDHDTLMRAVGLDGRRRRRLVAAVAASLAVAVFGVAPATAVAFDAAATVPEPTEPEDEGDDEEESDDDAPPVEPTEQSPLVWVGVGALVGGAVVYMVRRNPKASSGDDND